MECVFVGHKVRPAHPDVDGVDRLVVDGTIKHVFGGVLAFCRGSGWAIGLRPGQGGERTDEGLHDAPPMSMNYMGMSVMPITAIIRVSLTIVIFPCEVRLTTGIGKQVTCQGVAYTACCGGKCVRGICCGGDR